MANNNWFLNMANNNWFFSVDRVQLKKYLELPAPREQLPMAVSPYCTKEIAILMPVQHWPWCMHLDALVDETNLVFDLVMGGGQN